MSLMGLVISVLEISGLNARFVERRAAGSGGELVIKKGVDVVEIVDSGDTLTGIVSFVS